MWLLNILSVSNKCFGHWTLQLVLVFFDTFSLFVFATNHFHIPNIIYKCFVVSCFISMFIQTRLLLSSFLVLFLPSLESESHVDDAEELPLWDKFSRGFNFPNWRFSGRYFTNLPRFEVFFSFFKGRTKRKLDSPHRI